MHGIFPSVETFPRAKTNGIIPIWSIVAGAVLLPVELLQKYFVPVEGSIVDLGEDFDQMIDRILALWYKSRPC